MRPRSIAGLALFTIVFAAYGQDLEREPARRNPPQFRLLQAAGEQSQSASATDGRDFLTVWVDTRGGVPEIFMNLVRRDGTAVSPYGVRISGTSQWCHGPAVVWAGSHYVVVWAQNDGPPAPAVSAIRVSRDGVLLDEAPRRIFTVNLGFPFTPLLAANGERVMVAVAGNHYALIGPDGRPSAVTSEQLRWETVDALVPSGDSFLALSLWKFPSPIGSKLSAWSIDAGPDGPVAGASRVIAEHLDMEGFTAATHGGRTLLAYTAYRNGHHPVLARTLGPDGVLSEELEIGANTFAFYDWSPTIRVTGAGSGFLLAWEDAENCSFDVLAATVVDGRVASRFTLFDRDRWGELPAIAANGRDVFASWSERAELNFAPLKLYGGLSAGSSIGEPILLARSRSSQQTPQIAAGGDGYLVAWAEELRNDGVRSIFVQRHDRDGRALSVPRLLSDGATDSYAPQLAFNGELFLVAWAEAERTAIPRAMGRRVGAEGTPLDASAVAISPGGMARFSTVSVASNGRDFAVAYEPAYPDFHPELQAAQVVRVDSRFAMTAPVTLDPRDEPIHSPVRVTAMGDEYLVTWSHDGLLLATTLDNVFPHRAANIDARINPLVSCHASRCVSLSFDVWGSVTVRPFLPFVDTYEEMSSAIAIPYWPAGVALTRAGEGHLAVWTVRMPAGVAIRAARLNARGEPASAEIAVAQTRNVTGVAAAATGNRLAVAYAYADGADGVTRVAVKVARQP
jgi:hypothetical protein